MGAVAVAADHGPCRPRNGAVPSGKYRAAGLLLREPVALSMIAVTGLVVLCVFGARRYA